MKPDACTFKGEKGVFDIAKKKTKILQLRSVLSVSYKDFL